MQVSTQKMDEKEEPTEGLKCSQSVLRVDQINRYMINYVVAVNVFIFRDASVIYIVQTMKMWCEISCLCNMWS